MQFFERIKTGFRFQEKSYAFLIQHPILLLYWILPAAGLGIALVLAYKPVTGYLAHAMDTLSHTFHLHPTLLSIIMEVPLFIIAAAFIIHAYNIQTMQRTTVRGSCWHIITILPWLILLPLITNLFDIIQYFVSAKDYSNLAIESTPSNVTLPSIAGIALEIAWGLFTFYLLVITLIDKVNIFRAVWLSIKACIATWLEVISGKLCVFIPFWLFGTLYYGIASLLTLRIVNLASHAHYLAIIDGIGIFIIAGMIIPMSMLQLLLYRWYKEEKAS